jgi:hypothetical protein
MSIPTHAFATHVQIDHFCDYRCDYLLCHVVKTTINHLNDYKVICNCICNLNLRLMSIWMKMKMKRTFISFIFSDISK